MPELFQIIHKNSVLGKFNGLLPSRGGNLVEGRRGEQRMAFWLMKSEPGTYSWDDLVRDGGTDWDGVRNNAARLHLRAMKAGDEALFYHSGEERAVVGVMKITGPGEPDGEDGAWVKVPVKPVRALAKPVTL